MTILHKILTGVMALGAMAIATPAQAHDDHDRDRYDHRDVYHHHHHHWSHGRETVVIRERPTYVNDSGVSVAFTGHSRRHHHHDDR